jgi:hypothetical protein
MTYGVLWNQAWSFAGNRERTSVNQMFLQPFLAYMMKTLVNIHLAIRIDGELGC